MNVKSIIALVAAAGLVAAVGANVAGAGTPTATCASPYGSRGLLACVQPASTVDRGASVVSAGTIRSTVAGCHLPYAQAAVACVLPLVTRDESVAPSRSLRGQAPAAATGGSCAHPYGKPVCVHAGH